MSASNFPVSPAAYRYWDSSLVFGLPSEGQLSSPTCGALPFRSGVGYCSPNCIRGEDWAFLYSLASDMTYLATTWVWPDFYANAGSPNFYRVTPDNHNGMVQFLNDVQQAGCYGTDVWISEGDAYQLNVGQNQTPYEVIEPWLRGLIVNPVTFTSLSIHSGDPLQLYPLQQLFNDCKKAKCTIADGGELSSYPYWDYTDYYYESDPNPEIIEHTGRGMKINQLAIGPANHQETEMEAKVIYVMQCSMLSDDNWTTRYAAVCLPSRATLTTNNSTSYTYADPNFVAGGAAIAELAFEACGLEMRPSHTRYSNARSMCQVYDGPYLAVYPKWLLDY